MAFANSTSQNCPKAGLDGLLNKARHDSAEFPDVLANHLPMILLALDRLGAGPERESAFFTIYRDGKGLVPLPIRSHRSMARHGR